MRTKIILAVAMLCLGSGRVQAEPTATPTPPTSAPATQPVDPKVKVLIEQLGDDNPHVRDAALEHLRKLGKEALPALQAAVHDQDPQVRTSAEGLVAELTGTDKPKVAQNQNQASSSINGPGVIVLRGGGLVLNNLRIGQGNFQGQVQVQMNVVGNGQATRDISVNENGHKVHIHEDPDGVKVEVTDNGATKEYAAKNAAELKEKQPEGYKVYEQYGKNGAGQMKIEIAPNQ